MMLTLTNAAKSAYNINARNSTVVQDLHGAALAYFFTSCGSVGDEHRRLLAYPDVVIGAVLSRARARNSSMACDRNIRRLSDFTRITLPLTCVLGVPLGNSRIFQR
jgi:hypothetical protein